MYKQKCSYLYRFGDSAHSSLRPAVWHPLYALIVLVMLGGCTQREIHITSDPTGALVHLNDQEVGRTPLSVPFTFYGVYDVRLERAGYEPLWTEQRARAPWWDYPGPDLVAEVVPGVRVDIDWHFELEPAVEPERIDEDAMLERARRLREQVEGEEQ